MTLAQFTRRSATPLVATVALAVAPCAFAQTGQGDDAGLVDGRLLLAPIGGPTCPTDLDGDDATGFGDLLIVLASWGPCPDCPADINGDQEVGFPDLLSVLTAWGPCP